MKEISVGLNATISVTVENSMLAVNVGSGSLDRWKEKSPSAVTCRLSRKSSAAESFLFPFP